MPQVRRVLVVEDDRDTRTIMEEALVAGGFDVDTAADSSTALRKIGTTRYDLAVVDLMLPDLDGLLLRNKIEQTDSRLARRLVFTTGFTDQPAVVAFLRHAGRAFLAKPFHAEDLLLAVERSLAAAEEASAT